MLLVWCSNQFVLNLLVVKFTILSLSCPHVKDGCLSKQGDRKKHIRMTLQMN